MSEKRDDNKTSQYDIENWRLVWYNMNITNEKEKSVMSTKVNVRKGDSNGRRSNGTSSFGNKGNSSLQHGALGESAVHRPVPGQGGNGGKKK